MQEFHTLVDEDDKFVYFVSGSVNYDSVPRKSCLFGLGDEQKFIDRATNSCNKQADLVQKQLNNYLVNYPSTTQATQDYQDRLNEHIQVLRNKQFSVVKVSFTVV